MERLFKKFFHRPLKGQLMLLVMSITGVATVFLCLTFVSIDIMKTRNSLVKELTLVNDIIGKRISAGLRFNQPRKTANNLIDLKQKPSILAACVYNREKKIFAQYLNSRQKTPGVECPVSPMEANQHLFTWSTLAVNRVLLTKKRETIGFSNNNEILGYIYIVSDLKDIYFQLGQYLLITAVVALIVIILAYFLTSHMRRFITARIRMLVTATHSVKEGDYKARVELEKFDEIGELGDYFNSMMSKVYDLRENLEKKVEEKTIHLQTALKDAEDARDISEKANLAKSEFLRNMSHEFRTPLHAMKAYSSFGVNDALTGERKELRDYFDKISLVTQRLTSLVEALLSVAQLESGKQKFTMELRDLRASIDEVVVEQQSLLDKKGIKLDLQVPKQAMKACYDNGKIVQVLVNILGNAIKFTETGKTITISLKRTHLGTKNKKSAFRIEISDQGVGIPEDELKKVFDKFIQSSRTNDGSGGTGLGLAIAQKMVKGHGGKIWAENNKEGGTKFVVILPKEQARLVKTVRVI